MAVQQRGSKATDTSRPTDLSEFGLTPTTTDDTEDESKPWDDADRLDRLYNGERDLTFEQIADDVFAGEVSAETIRQRMEKFGLKEPGKTSEADPQSTAKMLLAKESDVDKPDGDDSYKQFTRTGRSNNAE
jgi:hypothetical protein